MDLICAGEMLIDFTPSKEEYGYIANPGGAPANVAISASRNGIDTAFLGILGEDDFGKRLKQVLLDNQVTMLCPNLTKEAVTTLAFVTLYEGGERSFTFVRKPGADMLLRKEDVKEEDIRSCRLFHAGSVSLSEDPQREAIIYGMKLAHKLGKIVSFDVNYRDMIWHDQNKCKKEVDALLDDIDLLKISEEELFFVGGQDQITSFMSEHEIKVLVVTQGEKGATCYMSGKSFFVASKKVTAVDATGAGDAFWGGFLSYLLNQGVEKASDMTEEMIKRALDYGNISGGLCVQRMGGIPALPTKEEIERAMH